ncbi:MAG: hypothetical protein AB8H79_25085 [Myxococcota bacterium]
MRAFLVGIGVALIASVPALAGPEDSANAVQPADQVDTAAVSLSAYNEGTLPVERPVLAALATLERHGTPAEVSLLQHLQEHENKVLANLAGRAIDAIRTRQRDDQRSEFSRSLTRESRKGTAIRRWRNAGLGPTEAACAAYADAVLGPDAMHSPVDPAQATPSAREFEDRGQVRQALRIHAQRAAAGNESGATALLAYGVDSERLLLGMLHSGWAIEPEALETLVRGGENLTVRVLAERVKRPLGSDQATAADALGRMLSAELRRSPLADADRDLATRTLRKAASVAHPEVRVIVREALAQADAPDRP